MFALALNIVLGVAALDNQQIEVTQKQPNVISDLVIRRDPNSRLIQVVQDEELKISLHMVDRSASEIFEYLLGLNINLVYSTADVPTNQITVNLHDVPVHDALVSLGSVLHGYWTAVHGVYTFHKGAPSNQSDVLTSTGVHHSALNYSTTISSVADPVTSGLSFTPTFQTNSLTPLVTNDTFKFQSNPTIVYTKPGTFSSSRLVFSASPRQDLKGLMHSLTAHQKSVMAKRGYLRVSELSARQKSLLGFDGSSGFMLKWSINGHSMTIKN